MLNTLRVLTLYTSTLVIPGRVLLKSHSLLPRAEPRKPRTMGRGEEAEALEWMCRGQLRGGFASFVICFDFFCVYRYQAGTEGPLKPASKESGSQKCDCIKRIEFLRQSGSITSTSQCHGDSNGRPWENALCSIPFRKGETEFYNYFCPKSWMLKEKKSFVILSSCVAFKYSK